jgi:CDP-glycerol glycerophosphotransferase (TagB/SpsB family)
LVTDYSSVMFDFANTGRPMLFFTYDLEHYRDRLRGIGPSRVYDLDDGQASAGVVDRMFSFGS